MWGVITIILIIFVKVKKNAFSLAFDQLPDLHGFVTHNVSLSQISCSCIYRVYNYTYNTARA